MCWVFFSFPIFVIPGRVPIARGQGSVLEKDRKRPEQEIPMVLMSYTFSVDAIFMLSNRVSLPVWLQVSVTPGSL